MHYDGDRGIGWVRPSTTRLTGAISSVLGVVLLAEGQIGGGVFVLAIGVVSIVIAERWHRAPNDVDGE
jgi:hypothetical protein